MGGWVDIFIRDYTEDPVDEGAFAINIEVQWPSPEVSYVRVSFEERFIQKLFRVGWEKNLDAEDRRLAKDRRALFIQWALVRLELWIEKREGTSKLMLTDPLDCAWAKEVMAGKLKAKSEVCEDQHYRYWLRNTDVPPVKSGGGPGA